jgi:tartrate-resistant acid phosphatase type 5
MKFLFTLALICCLTAFTSAQLVSIPADSITFAIIGDYGDNSEQEGDVAAMVKTWGVDFIITTGDNNYLFGGNGSIKRNIGKYYGDFIYNPTASAKLQCHGKAEQEKINRFFPSPGNHDCYTKDGAPYAAYFGKPMDYDFAWGPVHFFSLNTGKSGVSTRQDSLRLALAKATEPFKLVYFHHPPFSPGEHGSDTKMQWPFGQWGVDAVLTGHEHFYARIEDKTSPKPEYIICGSSGNTHLYGCHVNPLDSARFMVKCDDQHWGAMKVRATKTMIVFEYYIASSPMRPIDTYIIRK